jgi:hypothetical protein
MKETGKKTLLNLMYYGLVIVMVALIVSFFIGINNNGIALWARIVSMIICIALALLVVYMIICMYSGISAFPVGFILYGLTIASVIVAFIYYMRLTPANGLLTVVNLNIFMFVIGNLLLINALTIAIYITGLYIKQPNEPTNKRFSTAK